MRQVEERTGVIRQFAACFTDHRDPERIEHPLGHLIAQRVYGLALGYEDLNDHDLLRADPLLAAAVGDGDPLGETRRRAQDRGKALAGKSTLNRLELTPVGADEEDRYKKVVLGCAAADRLLVDLFLQAHRAAPPREVVLDFDATDDPVHGAQLGRYFHGYYGEYCFLPLYVMCGEFVLAAKLRPGNVDASAGALEVLVRIVDQVRAAWPQVRIVVRGDSGFCREALLGWCETPSVDYVLGLAQNARLVRAIGEPLHWAQEQCQQTRRPAREFAEMQYRTHKSWSRTRRVVAKAEALPDGPGATKANPRFVVTSLSAEAMAARPLYEEFYCARGDMENRIKEQQLCLFADRTSAATMRANQTRLYFSTLAYSLMMLLRRLGLKDTELAPARCDTIRLKLLKIGARVRVTARKVWVSLSSACVTQNVFARVYQALERLAAWPGPITLPAVGPAAIPAPAGP